MGKRRWAKQAPDTEEERRKKNSTKYHFLLFVEKQKVQRKLIKVRAKLAEEIQAGKPAVSETRKELAKWEADLQYVENYPLEQKYCALFPKVDSEESKKRREEMRELIRKRLIEKANKGEDEEEMPDDDFFAAGDAEPDEEKTTTVAKEAPPAPLSKGSKGKGKGAKGAKGEGKGAKGSKGAKGASKGASGKGSFAKGKGKGDAAKGFSSDAGSGLKRSSKEEDPNVHPSWAAKKSAAQTGSLADTKFEGKKVTFDSDDEGGSAAAPPVAKKAKLDVETPVKKAKKSASADVPAAVKSCPKPEKRAPEKAAEPDGVDASLHPSWVASQKKKAEAAATFAGKRMTFDSDDE